MPHIGNDLFENPDVIGEVRASKSVKWAINKGWQVGLFLIVLALVAVALPTDPLGPWTLLQTKLRNQLLGLGSNSVVFLVGSAWASLGYQFYENTRTHARMPGEDAQVLVGILIMVGLIFGGLR
jgi:hypothetical protein